MFGILVLGLLGRGILWSMRGMRGSRGRGGGGVIAATALIGLALVIIGYVGYFNTALFPAIAGVRLMKRAVGGRAHDLHRPAEIVNRALARVFALERYLVLHPGLPFGSSVLAVARR